MCHPPRSAVSIAWYYFEIGPVCRKNSTKWTSLFYKLDSTNWFHTRSDVDRLCPIFPGSIERTFLFIRQTQPFLKRFCKRNIFECIRIVVRKSLAPKAEAKKAEVLIMMRMKPQDHPFQRAETVEYSQNCRSSRYLLWESYVEPGLIK